jgi:hypothetical protein
MGLEGIVSKRLGLRYRSGARRKGIRTHFAYGIDLWDSPRARCVMAAVINSKLHSLVELTLIIMRPGEG